MPTQTWLNTYSNCNSIGSIILTSHRILALKATQLERIHRSEWIQTCWTITGNSEGHRGCPAQNEQNPLQASQMTEHRKIRRAEFYRNSLRINFQAWKLFWSCWSNKSILLSVNLWCGHPLDLILIYLIIREEREIKNTRVFLNQVCGKKKKVETIKE